MSDLEKYIAKTQKAFCVEEVATKTTYYNCFGEKIDQQVKTSSTIYRFDKDTGKWEKGGE